MASPRGRTILIVGCGELGSRHLQSVATMQGVQSIEVVDPRSEGLNLGQERIDQIDTSNNGIKFEWLTGLDSATKDGDLCIVSTQAQGRCKLVKEIFTKLGYSRFLLEKIVAQSVGEMEDLIDFCQHNQIYVWVNMQTRSYPIHLRVREKLEGGGPIIYNVVGGNQGLATNGVHNVDLFALYDGSSVITSSGSSVDNVLHPSKRGDTLYDLSGTLTANTDNGSRFTLTYARDHSNSEQISISNSKYRCVIDHFYRWAVESDEQAGWEWSSVPFEGDILVSQLTKSFVSEIFEDDKCILPSLYESLTSHKFILDELSPYFKQLLGQDIEYCPVT